MNTYWNATSDAAYNNDTRYPSIFTNGSKVPYLITQMKVQRTKSPHPYGRRSKYVVRPDAVVMAGNHVAHKFVDGKYKYYNISVTN